MALSDVFRGRRVRKVTRQFAELIDRGEIDAALQLYESELSAPGVDPGKTVRVLYHLYCWISRKTEQDARAVEALAANEPPESAVAQAARCMQRLRRDLDLAAALRQRNPEYAIGPADPSAAPESRAVEQLALAILETYRPLREPAARERAAQAVERLLPPPDHLEGRARLAFDALLLWSAWNLQRHKKLFQDPLCKAAQQAGEYRPFRLAVADAWGQSELAHGRSKAALDALQELLKNGTLPAQILAIALSWSSAALQAGKAEAALALVSARQLVTATAGVPQGNALLALVSALAYLKDGQLARGRAILSSLLDSPDPGLRAQVRFLSALSLLAETQSWAASDAAGDGVDQKRLHNQTLWRSLRPELDTAVASAVDASDGAGWRGHLLEGLIAFVDSSVCLSVDQLASFSRAMENLPLDAGRARLKAIEGVLRTRARATEEAVAYIEQGEHHELRALQDQVLAPLGDAIPPIVRAAVYLALWSAEPAYDPIRDLQRIPTTPDSEPHIQECIAQVQTTRVLQDLARLCRQAQLKKDGVPPALGALQHHPATAQIGSLALAVLRLRQGDWRGALEALPSDNARPDDELRGMATRIRAYAAWQLGDIEELASEDCTSYFGRSPRTRSALDARRVTAALEANNTGEIATVLGMARRLQRTPDELVTRLTSLAFWLLNRRRPQDVLRLVNVLRTLAETNAIPKPVIERLRPWTAYFASLATAQIGQFTACDEACQEVLSLPAGPGSRAGQLSGPARLIKLEASLALTAQADQDVRVRWPSVQRALLEQADTLNGSAALEPYGFLIGGLVSFLATDVLVEESVLLKLMQAQRVLPLAGYAAFVQNAISRLDWRRRVLADFWNGLARGDAKLSRSIYQREIQPAFGERVPHPIQLGMIIVDWDTGQADTPELLKRLTLLEHDAPELGGTIIQKVRDHVQEGDRIRRFTQLVKKNAFEDIIEFVQKSPWADSGIPIAVGIGLLYAYYKTEQMAEAERLASILNDNPHFPDWVRDYGSLIVGFIYHRKGDYPRAAEAFGKTQTSTVLGHNTDKYWAVSHFADGLQKLKVDQKEDAFKAFRLSLSQRGSEQSNANLAPLFVHFGLKNIEAGNGGQAQQAFALMKESLGGLSENESVVRSRIVADMGELLSHSLMELAATELPGGDSYLRMVAQLDKPKQKLPDADRRRLEGSLRRMAIAQELRRRCLQRSKNTGSLAQYLEDQCKALQALERQLAEHSEGEDKALKHDPVMLVVQAMIALRLKGAPDLDAGLEHLTQAARLGLQSRQLADLIQRIAARKKESIDRQKAVLDLFDSYLLLGTVPPHAKEGLVRRDDLAELYRIGRNYTLRDLAVIQVQSGADILARRVAHLVCQWVEVVAAPGEKVKSAAQRLKELLTPDGPPGPEFDRLLSEIGNQLKLSKDEHAASLGMLCTEAVDIRRLESSATSRESAVVQHLADRLRHAATH